MGLALVSNPRVLFLDEPTSGLDSFTANEVHYTLDKRGIARGILLSINDLLRNHNDDCLFIWAIGPQLACLSAPQYAIGP